MAKERLSPKEAADLIGKTQLTLARWRKAGAGPPYIKVGERYEYRRDLLLAWRNGDHTHVGQMVNGWPEVRSVDGETNENQIFEWNMENVTQRIHIWKQLQLWYRAERVMNNTAFSPDMIASFDEDCELFSQPNGISDQEWVIGLHQKMKAFAPEMGFSFAESPSNETEKNVRLAFIHLLIAAIRDILNHEKAWRAMDWSTMPNDVPWKRA